MKPLAGAFGGLLLLFTLPAHAEWGRDATFTPGWERIGKAAKQAFFHPMTWIPAVAGVAVYASGQDDDWAEELYEDTPVFGSREDADQAADDYRAAASVLWMVSILTTESGDRPVRNKARGALVQIGAIAATRLTSNTLKSVVDRDEPGKSSDEAEGDAFPSNHATDAFAHAALVPENMKHTRLPRLAANLYTGAAYVAASGAAWGRIEAGGHHISDQLVGAAVGNFVATFINNAFLGSDSHLQVGAGPDDAVVAVWSTGF